MTQSARWIHRRAGRSAQAPTRRRMPATNHRPPPTAAVDTLLQIAGRNVLIRYADAELAKRLSRATRHLAAATPGAPDLTINAWIDHEIPTGLPADWPSVGMSYSDVGSAVFTWHAPEGPLYSYDRERRHGWAVFSSLSTVPTWDQAAPFRRILHWWAVDHGAQLIHAAAVGNSAGGLLLVGRGGSGKSTTSLACLEAGLGFAGDDYCVLSPGDPPRVDSLYLSAKADARAAALIPGLGAAFAQAPFISLGKSVVFADQIRPEALCAGFPLRGIVVPHVIGEASSRLTRLRPAEALRALAPSTILQMPGGRSNDLAGMADVVRRVPAWALTLGSPGSAAALIAGLLEQNEPT